MPENPARIPPISAPEAGNLAHDLKNRAQNQRNRARFLRIRAGTFKKRAEMARIGQIIDILARFSAGGPACAPMKARCTNAGKVSHLKLKMPASVKFQDPSQPFGKRFRGGWQEEISQERGRPVGAVGVLLFEGIASLLTRNVVRKSLHMIGSSLPKHVSKKFQNSDSNFLSIHSLTKG